MSPENAERAPPSTERAVAITITTTSSQISSTDKSSNLCITDFVACPSILERLILTMDLFPTQPAASASASELSGSNDKSNEKIPKACSRCHKQKLRCRRKIGEVSCERCARLKTSCHPRAARGLLKPRELAAEYGRDNCGACELIPSHELVVSTPNLNSDQMATDLMAAEWSYFPHAEGDIGERRAAIPTGFCDSIPGYSFDARNTKRCMFGQSGSPQIDLTLIDENFMSNTSNFDSFRTPDHQMRSINIDYNGSDHERVSLETVGGKLTRLNTALFECAAKLPNITKVGDAITSGVRISRAQTLFVIDEVFNLTTEFIEVTKCLLLVDCEKAATTSPMNPIQSVTQSMVSLAPPISEVMPSGQPAAQSHVTESFSQIDEPTTFTLMACHWKLTEIYTALLKMMEACINYSLFPNLREDWAIILPKLEFGSITSPPIHVDVNRPLSPPSASSMYMVLVTMISSQLWEHLRDALALRSESDTSEFSRAVGGTMWESLRYRTDHMSQNIDATKHLLQRYSVPVL